MGAGQRCITKASVWPLNRGGWWGGGFPPKIERNWKPMKFEKRKCVFGCLSMQFNYMAFYVKKKSCKALRIWLCYNTEVKMVFNLPPLISWSNKWCKNKKKPRGKYKKEWILRRVSVREKETSVNLKNNCPVQLGVEIFSKIFWRKNWIRCVGKFNNLEFCRGI